MERDEITRALSVTAVVASELGLQVDDAIVLQHANRLAVRLIPCEVVARVAATVRRNREVATFELEVARRLEAAGSPVAVLEPRVEPLVHERDGFVITFWRYYEPMADGGIPAAEYARALEQLHDGMRELDVAAPRFTERVDEAEAIVRDRQQSPDLADAERELLSNTLRSLRRAVAAHGATEQLLHGEPHPGNVLTTESGLRFVDFESCCIGPVEFDVAHAPDEVDEHYAGAARLLLRDCRILKMAMVAAWRADRDDAFPNGREMRDELISEIRAALDLHGIEVRH